MDRTEIKRRQILAAFGNAQRADRGVGLNCGQVMTVSPSCVRLETPAIELVKLFHAKQFRHLLVTDEAERLVGVISDRDVIQYLGPTRHPDSSVLADIAAEKIMSTDLVTIGPGTSLERGVAIMLDYGISCLPVLADKVLVGILTNTDLHIALEVLLQTLRHSLPGESGTATTANLHN